MSARAGLLIAGLAAALILPAAAHAAYPGQNGKLAFVRDGQIWTLKPDGTGEAQLTSGSEPSSEPEWSPDGSRIAYTKAVGARREVRVMNADGSGDAHVYGQPGLDGVYSPTWSPDGRQLAFLVAHNCTADRCWWYLYDIYVAQADGSDARARYMAGANDLPATHLDWSPAGDEFAFGGLPSYSPDEKWVNLWPVDGTWNSNRHLGEYDPGRSQFAPAWAPDASEVGVVRDTVPASSPELDAVDPDGTARRQLTTNDVAEFGLDWSPDGERIVYSGEVPGCTDDCNPELHVMNDDGTGRVRLTNTPAAETEPDWQPVVGAPPPSGYARPKSAQRFRVPLVPAYEPCAAPNRTHGPPLAFGSCNPPAQTSPRLTVGTPDGGGGAARMTGFLKLRVRVDDPATATDEAEVRFSVKVTDVRCRPGLGECGANDEGGGDYYGSLRLRLPLRLTDRYNPPAPGGVASATGDEVVEIPVPCYWPTDPEVGSTCRMTSSLDNWYPGSVSGGRRAIVELGGAEVLDGGSDGRAFDGVPFLRPGVFVP